MRSSSVSRAVRLAVALSVAMAVLGLRTASSQSSVKNDGKGIHYTATAVTMDAPTGGATAQIDIYIERWSTDAEWTRLMNTMLEAGPDSFVTFKPAALALIKALLPYQSSFPRWPVRLPLLPTPGDTIRMAVAELGWLST